MQLSTTSHPESAFRGYFFGSSRRNGPALLCETALVLGVDALARYFCVLLSLLSRREVAWS
jgi:hypothetical protein